MSASGLPNTMNVCVCLWRFWIRAPSRCRIRRRNLSAENPPKRYGYSIFKLTRTVAYYYLSALNILYDKIIKSRGALCRIDDANVRYLIVRITALCSNLEHLYLTR